MPRSGSTLLEQILASHEEIEGTRELPEMSLLAASLARRAETAAVMKYPEVISTIDEPELRELGASYIHRTRVYRKTDCRYFIDKMPNNWLHVPLIIASLPNAIIIDSRRDAMDCCLSNFKQHFARGQHFSYDLKELGKFFGNYMEAMRLADAAMPGRILHLPYERLVSNFEDEVRSILQFVGVDFDSKCLRFWENNRPVQTASSEQVRRPISLSSINYWRNYEPYLGDLKGALSSIYSSN